jgi:hypothetical protein
MYKSSKGMFYGQSFLEIVVRAHLLYRPALWVYPRHLRALTYSISEGLKLQVPINQN